MEFELREGSLVLNKKLTDLDNKVLEFVSLLDELGIRYVIMSGYVAIFFGRSRSTEDIDLFIEKIEFGKFGALFDRLIGKNYWIINTDDKKEAFEFLTDGLAIRVAEKGKVIPNFEMKFPKKETDFLSFSSPLRIIVNGRRFYASPLEVQIPFKLWLGTDKDIEDAVHMGELFRGKLNKELMASISKKLEVQDEMRKYGIL